MSGPHHGMSNPVSSTAPRQELDACEHSASSGSEHGVHFKNKSNCMPLLYMFTVITWEL